MEYDKLQGSSKLFFFGIFCLFTSLGLFFFSIYILPYFIWEVSYDMPEFIFTLLAKYQDDYNYSVVDSKTIIWFMFFVPSLFTGLIAYLISRHMDKKIYDIDVPKTKENNPSGDVVRQIKESASFGGKIFGLIILVLVAMLLVQYLLKSTV